MLYGKNNFAIIKFSWLYAISRDRRCGFYVPNNCSNYYKSHLPNFFLK